MDRRSCSADNRFHDGKIKGDIMEGQTFPGYFTQELAPIEIAPPVFAGIASLTARPNGSLRATFLPAIDDTLPIRYRVYIQAATATNLFLAVNRAIEAFNSPIDIFMLADGSLLQAGITYYVGIRALDGNGREETNTVSLNAVSVGVLTDDLSTIANNLLGGLTTLNDDIADVIILNGDLQSNITDLNAAKIAIEAAATSIEGSATSLDNTNTDLQNTNTDLQGTITTITGAASDIDAAASDLTAIASTLDGQITDLNESIADLDAQIIAFSNLKIGEIMDATLIINDWNDDMVHNFLEIIQGETQPFKLYFKSRVSEYPQDLTGATEIKVAFVTGAVEVDKKLSTSGITILGNVLLGTVYGTLTPTETASLAVGEGYALEAIISYGSTNIKKAIIQNAFNVVQKISTT